MPFLGLHGKNLEKLVLVVKMEPRGLIFLIILSLSLSYTPIRVKLAARRRPARLLGAIQAASSSNHDNLDHDTGDASSSPLIPPLRILYSSPSVAVVLKPGGVISHSTSHTTSMELPLLQRARNAFGKRINLGKFKGLGLIILLKYYPTDRLYSVLHLNIISQQFISRA